MCKKAVIIGAGQTGRGYVARYLVEKNYEITFIDCDKQLISYLQEDVFFCIHFYNKDRSPFMVKSYKAYLNTDKNSIQAIHDADYIFTSIGEQNLVKISKIIAKGLEKKQKNTAIFTNENGINPAKVLRNSLDELNIQANYVVSQTAVFCSTININSTRLDILSQNDNYYPYDADEFKNDLDFIGAVKIHNFENFLKRKIYTYNCLAGIISYCGFLKGYDIYGEAANDSEIVAIMDTLLTQLNPALADYFNIPLSDQIEFSNKALVKFKDKHILDYVIKNGRDAKRKLGETERIIAPMRIIEKHHGNADILYFNAAAALYYWQKLSHNGREVIMTRPPIQELCYILSIDENSALAKKVSYYFDYIQSNETNIKLKEILNIRS